jgi:predicted nucleotidyltransferase component of viral defense system
VLEAAIEHAGLPLLELNDGVISYVGPLEARKPRRIKLDISDTEVVESVEKRSILEEIWSDLPTGTPFNVCTVEEIAAEKLRCIIQRVQCRDIYDLYRLAEDVGVLFSDIRPLFERKSIAKGIDPTSFGDRFADRSGRYRSRWSSEMSEHLTDPPRFDDVARSASAPSRLRNGRRLRSTGSSGNSGVSQVR